MANNLIAGIMFSLVQLSPLLSVLFLSVIVILIYLYFASEIMNKKIVIGLIFGLLIIFAGLNIFSGLKKKPPEFAFHLTIFPLATTDQDFETTWLAKTFWETLNNQMADAVHGRALVITANYLAPLADSDSLLNLNYLQRINHQINGEYCLVGWLNSDLPFPWLDIRLIATGNNQTLLNETIELSPEKIPLLTGDAVEKIFKALKFVPKAMPKTVHYVSTSSYKDYLHALTFFANKDYSGAVQMAENALAADSSLKPGYVLAGKAWLMQAIQQKEKGLPPAEFLQKSFEWLSRALEKDSTDGEACALLGEYYIYLERWSLAEYMLTRALKLNPHYPRLYLSLSRLHAERYQKLGFRNEEELFKRALLINPCYEDAYLMLSDYYLFKNKRDAAITWLQKYLQINPNSVPVLMALGKIYLVRNEILKIIEIYNRVIELDSDNSDAYYNLGILYYNSEDYDHAEKFFQKAISLDNHLNSHLYLAYLYEIQGDKDRAIEHLRFRIRNRKGFDDEFAEEARKRLFVLMHSDSSTKEN